MLDLPNPLRKSPNNLADQQLSRISKETKERVLEHQIDRCKSKIFFHPNRGVAIHDRLTPMTRRVYGSIKHGQ